MVYRLFLAVVLFFGTLTTHSALTTNRVPKNGIAINRVTPFFYGVSELEISTLYHSLRSNSFQLPKIEVFSNAIKGYFRLKEMGIVQKNILTIIDFSLSSAQKRLWVIDMTTNSVIMQSVVAHGRNSGLEFASAFSNQTNSLKSSLGFYVTGETYSGKHGLSLKLDGLEQGVNSNARERAVVMHGADYASENIIKQQGRLGRSQGCPAVPYGLHKKIIDMIKDKSCLFIYHPSRTYPEQDKLFL